MSQIQITQFQGQLRVDSRLVAQILALTHKSFKETIRKYLEQIEQAFGEVPFETAVVKGHRNGGNPESYYLLNEDQATFVMTLSRNTPEVIQAKLALVTAFSKAKQELSKPQAQSQPQPAPKSLLDISHDTTMKALGLAGIDKPLIAGVLLNITERHHPELKPDLDENRKLIAKTNTHELLMTPTEIANQISDMIGEKISAIAVNKALINLDLQIKNPHAKNQYGKKIKGAPDYLPTQSGTKYSDNTLSTGKAGDNTTYQHLKWTKDVVNMILKHWAS